MNYTTHEIWTFLVAGYVLSVLIETPILCVGMSLRHPLRRRLLAGLWLTACTYPIVILVLPALLFGRTDWWVYLTVAETFAPLAECGLFWLWMTRREEPYYRPTMYRDFTVIVAANLASFLAGQWLINPG